MILQQIILAATIFLFAVGSSTAQWWKVVTPEDILLTEVGFAADMALTTHSGNFTLPYAPTCCSEYTTALTIGPSLSVFIRQEVIKPLRFSLRATYSPYDATFSTDENVLFTNSTDGVIRHTLSTKQSFLGAELLADIRIIDPVRLMVGVNAGTMLGSTYSQKEELVIPGTGTFENGRRVRNETSNETMQNVANPYMNIVGGLGFDLPITSNRSVVLTPEILYSVGLNDMVEGVSWKSNQLRIGAAIAFALNAPEPPVPVERIRETTIDSVYADLPPDGTYKRVAGRERIDVDTVVTTDLVTITERSYRTDTVYSPLLPEINSRIVAQARMEDGTLSSNFTVKVSTQFVTEALPVLPVVFFEPQSISLSFRYRQIASTGNFSESDVDTKTTAVHRDVLNVIGSRMKSLPGTVVKLRGTADPTTESGRCDLAQKRALAVREYLTRVWSIDESRISIVNDEMGSNCAPPRPTREQSEAGYSENRRVEIETDDLDLIAPVAKRRFNEARTVSPPKLEIDPSGSSQQYITGWEMTGTSGSKVVFTQQGEGPPKVITQQLSTTTADIMDNDKPLIVTMELQAIRGVKSLAVDSLIVVRDTLSTELERLTLTLFGISSDEVTPVAEEQIKEFVRNVPRGSTVIVRGYADLLGNAEFNKQLSRRRADAVCSSIKKHIKKRIDLQCTDIATDRFPPGIDSYDTPEERMLSRTVQIEIKKAR